MIWGGQFKYKLIGNQQCQGGNINLKSYMSHLFKKTEYIQFRTKYYPQIKKSLQQKIQYVSENLADNLHPIEGLEETIIDQSQFNLVYEGQTLVLPQRLLKTEDFSSFLNMNTINQSLSDSQIKELLSLTPNGKLQEIQYALSGKGFYEKHLTEFQRKSKSGYFSILRQKEDQIIEKLSICKLKQIYQDLYGKLLRNKNSKSEKNTQFTIKDDISEVNSLQDLEQLNEFSDDNSHATQTQEEIQQKPAEQFTKQIFFKYDYSKLKTQQQMIALGQQKRQKVGNVTYKMTLPSRPRNMEWIQNYRKQQVQRYLNPTKPWGYVCQDGRKVTVAPVAKKLSVLTGKPRDHPLLKTERPACVTILTLVRDAAARLPNGVGTRADICQLLKQSQYINESLPQDKVSNIVSGALDRLHYMSDACVKYDSEKKLWIYLHIDRNNQHPGWGQDGDEYTQKAKKKKKVQ